MQSGCFTMAPPIGIKLGKGLTIGPKIGEGAQCPVYEVLLKGEPSGLVAKSAPIPPPKTNPKAKPKPDEINANSLNKEFAFYNGTLKDVQGSMVPVLGCAGLFGRGREEVDGFRFLVIERMETDFFAMVPQVLQNATTVNLAPVALRLLEMVQFIHSTGYVLIDVKPENIMLAFDKKKNKKPTKTVSVAETIAERLRMLDFGLVQFYIFAKKHKDNVISDGSNLVGTPLYSSRHVHEGNTPSRRDDLEAMGLVLAELIIRLHAAANDATEQYESTDIPSYLPWALEANTMAIGRVKGKMMDDINSEFYKRMGSRTVAQTMFQFFQITHETEYEKKPKYEDMEALFSSLEVPVHATKRSSGAASKTPTKKVKHASTASSSTKELPASTSKPKTVLFVPKPTATTSPKRGADKKKKSDTEGVSAKPSSSSTSNAKPKTIPYQPPVAAKTESKTRNKTPLKEKDAREKNNSYTEYVSKPRRAKVPCHYGIIDESDSDDEMEEGVEKEPAVPIFDQDMEDVENASVNVSPTPMDVDANPKAQLKANSSLSLSVVGGPHKDQNIKLTLTKALDTVIIGTNRRSKTSKPNETMLVLDKDMDIADKHCVLEFHVTRGGTPQIVLTTSVEGIKVGNDPVVPGKKAYVWPGSVMYIGPQTVIHVN